MANKLGLTLLETLLSVVILSSGLIFVFRPFLQSLDAFREVDTRLEISRLISDQIRQWEMKEKSKAQLLTGTSNGTLLGRRTAYTYAVSAQALGGDSRLRQVDVQSSWITSARQRSIKRSLYLLFPYEPED